MRVLLVALASLVLNVAFWLRYHGLDELMQAATRDAQKDLILHVLSAYLVLEGILLVRRNFRLRRMTRKEDSAPSALEEQLDALYQQRELFQEEIQKAREELAFMNRRMQSVASERDSLKALIEQGQSENHSNVKEPRESGSPVAAVPLTRSARL